MTFLHPTACFLKDNSTTLFELRTKQLFGFPKVGSKNGLAVLDEKSAINNNDDFTRILINSNLKQAEIIQLKNIGVISILLFQL